MATAKQAVQQTYLLEPDDVWVQQGPMVDELPLDILVNLQFTTQPGLRCVERTLSLVEVSWSKHKAASGSSFSHRKVT